MDIQSSLPSPSREEHLARLEAEEQANERLYKVLDIGQAMLQSGAEVSRVEDSLRRICLAYGAERADVFTITSNIMVTMYSRQYGALTQIRRVAGQQYDLHRLELLNLLCRRICAERLTLEETERALDAIRDEPQYSFPVQLLTFALISASFSLFFGGSALDAAASGVIGAVLKVMDQAIRRTEANAFLSALLCSCLGGLLAALSVRIGLGRNVDMISIGNIMLLIPGIALTFALLFHVRREKLLLASLGGLLAWSVYLLMGRFSDQDVVRYFVASVVLTVYAELLARRVKCPATLFLVTAAVPLIPGGSLYHTMEYFMESDLDAFSHQGLNTVLLAVAIAVGMLFPSSIFQLLRRSGRISR